MTLAILPQLRLRASGDMAGEYEAFQELRRRQLPSPGDGSDLMRYWIGRNHGRFGELDAAEEAMHAIETPSLRYEGLALLAFGQTNDFLPRLDIDALMPPSALRVAGFVHLARTGRPEEAKKAMRHSHVNWTRGSRWPWQGGISFWKGLDSEILLAEGDQTRAKDLLEQTVPEPFGYHAETFLRAEALAMLRLASGDPEGAVRALERVTKVDSHRITHMTMALRSQSFLLRLYRELGREEEEQELTQELRKQLQFADADHPILRLLDDTEESPLLEEPFAIK